MAPNLHKGHDLNQITCPFDEKKPDGTSYPKNHPWSSLKDKSKKKRIDAHEEWKLKEQEKLRKRLQNNARKQAQRKREKERDERNDAAGNRGGTGGNGRLQITQRQRPVQQHRPSGATANILGSTLALGGRVQNDSSSVGSSVSFDEDLGSIGREADAANAVDWQPLMSSCDNDLTRLMIAERIAGNQRHRATLQHINQNGMQTDSSLREQARLENERSDANSIRDMGILMQAMQLSPPARRADNLAAIAHEYESDGSRVPTDDAKTPRTKGAGGRLSDNTNATIYEDDDSGDIFVDDEEPTKNTTSTTEGRASVITADGSKKSGGDDANAGIYEDDDDSGDLFVEDEEPTENGASTTEGRPSVITADGSKKSGGDDANAGIYEDDDDSGDLFDDDEEPTKNTTSTIEGRSSVITADGSKESGGDDAKADIGDDDDDSGDLFVGDEEPTEIETSTIEGRASVITADGSKESGDYDAKAGICDDDDNSGDLFVGDEEPTEIETSTIEGRASVITADGSKESLPSTMGGDDANRIVSDEEPTKNATVAIKKPDRRTYIKSMLHIKGANKKRASGLVEERRSRKKKAMIRQRRMSKEAMHGKAAIAKGGTVATKEAKADAEAGELADAFTGAKLRECPLLLLPKILPTIREDSEFFDFL